MKAVSYENGSNAYMTMEKLVDLHKLEVPNLD